MQFCLKISLSQQIMAIKPDWLSRILATIDSELVIKNTLVPSGSTPSRVCSDLTKNRLAILPITGIIFPSENMLSQLLGATTLDKFTQDVQQALENPAISEIVLHIDSPGGMVTGVHECAEMIYQARGKKPITAYVSGLGASAAYWLASACDEIVCDATASVGSIGVLSVHTDDKQRKAQQGLSQIQIVSSQSPRKRLDITTEEGRVDVQVQVDAIAEVFVSKVARNRKVSTETVLADFGQGSLLVGEQAVKNGLADRLGSLQQLIQEKTKNIQTKKLSYPPPREKLMSDMLTDAEIVPQITADYLIQHHAGLVQSFQQVGAQQERERIQAVEAQLIPGHETLIQQLKFDGKTIGAEAAMQVLAAERVKPKALQSNGLEPLPITRSVMEEGIADKKPKKVLSLEEKWQMNWQNDASLQSEFSCLETYLAFVKAEQNGQVNVLNRTE